MLEPGVSGYGVSEERQLKRNSSLICAVGLARQLVFGQALHRDRKAKNHLGKEGSLQILKEDFR